MPEPPRYEKYVKGKVVVVQVAPVHGVPNFPTKASLAVTPVGQGEGFEGLSRHLWKGVVVLGMVKSVEEVEPVM